MYSCARCRHSNEKRLCQRCTQTVDGQLASLPRFYADLAGFLAPGSGASGEGFSRRVEAPLPARLGPLSLRGAGGIVGVLGAWESDWRDVLGWSQAPARGRIEQAVEGHAIFLRNNLLWCVDRHPAVKEFVDEIGELHRSCQQEIDGPSETRAIGYCPAILEDDAPCGARLYANPYAPAIRCRYCGSSWEGSAWLALAGQMRG